MTQQLRVTYSGQAKIGSGNERKSAETPLIFNPDGAAGKAALMIQELHTLIGQHIIQLQTGDTEGLPPTISAWCAWLIERTPRIRSHPRAAQMVDDLARLLEKATTIIDRPPEQLFCGKCPICAADLYADYGAVSVTCKKCHRAGLGEVHDVSTKREELLAMKAHQWVTIGLCVAILGDFGMPVQLHTIHNWTRLDRGQRLAPRGVDLNGRNLYRVGDVIDLARSEANRRPVAARHRI